MNRAALREEICALASAAQHGELTPTQGQRLADLLRNHPEARELWFAYQDLELGLTDWASHPVLAGKPEQHPSRPVLLTTRGWWHGISEWQRNIGALAAGLIVIAAGFWVLHVSAPEETHRLREAPSGYVATLASQDDCVWTGAALTTGQRLNPGTLRLERGSALLNFDGGARLALVGPAELAIESPGAARVVRGKAAVRASAEAVGFRVTTPAGTAVDLGTEFLIEVSDRGETECKVFEGEVEWHADGPTRRVALLGEGEGLRIRGGRSDAIMVAPAHFRDFAPRPQKLDGQLLAYEPFEYTEPRLPAGELQGGFGWLTPWRGRFVATDKIDVDPQMGFDVGASLAMPAGLTAARGGSLIFGSTRDYRLRALPRPVDFGSDGVFYFSFLMRVADLLPTVSGRPSPAMRFEFRSSTDYWSNALGVSLGTQGLPFLFANGNNTWGGTTLSHGETVFVVLKIASSRTGADQMFLKIYRPGETLDVEETPFWTVVSRDLSLGCSLDYLILAIPKTNGGRLDEIRYGTSWRAVVPFDTFALQP